LTRQVDARRIAADLHVQFTRAADAANRAVMADDDDASATAAREARDATQAVERDLRQLRPLLESLGYGDELRFLATFEERFAEYRKLDEEILPAASAAFEPFENTNRGILALSRRHSEVRSLASSLGRKRMVTAVADDQLRELEEALATHDFTGTR
jgi:hypothetical protein